MLLLAIAATATARAAEPWTPTVAIWQAQQLQFTYTSETTYYDCAELRRRVVAILLAVGARADSRVNVECFSGLSNHGTLTLSVVMPREATADNVAAATTFDATQRLAAHVRGETLPTPNDLEHFPAVWRQIAVTKQRRLNIGSSDCELLHDMAEHVFPQLAIRVPRHGLQCSAGPSQLRPRLIVEALVPIERITRVRVATTSSPPRAEVAAGQNAGHDAG